MEEFGIKRIFNVLLVNFLKNNKKNNSFEMTLLISIQKICASKILENINVRSGSSASFET